MARMDQILLAVFGTISVSFLAGAIWSFRKALLVARV